MCLMALALSTSLPDRFYLQIIHIDAINSFFGVAYELVLMNCMFP